MAFNKLFFIVLGFFLATISAYAQGVPSGINYQAVLRNHDGEIIASQPIRLRISVFNPDARDYYYTESHQVITNQVGIFTLVVGGGTPEKGKFADIPWSTANTWLEVSYDTDNNGTYEVTGSTQMLSVPYAFYAERAGTADQSVKNGTQSADGDEGDVMGENDWQLKGNLEVDETINFLGSKNYADLIFKTHDTERIRITKGFASDQHDALVQIKEDVLAEQDVWVLGMLTVEGETLLNGDLTVVGDAVFKKNMIIGQDLDIDGFLHVKKDADFDANVNIDVNLHVGNDVDIDHNLNVDNDAHIGSDLDVDGNGNIDVDLHVGRDADIDRNLNVDNDTHIGSDLDVDGNGNIDMNLHVGKDADIDNNLNVDNDTHIGSDLDVDGNGNIDMNLHVGKDADIDNDLNVDEDVHIGNDLDVDHNVNIDNDLTVRNNASILGDLDVDGTGTFLDLVVERDLSVGRDADIDRNLNVDVDVHIGNNLDVDNNINVDNSVHIGVNLDVDNNINVDNSINVDQNVTVNNNLYVDNNTTINNNLNVTNDVYVGGNLQVENPITANCRLVVNSCVSGDDQTLDNYPVLVQGGSQGIAIKVDGSRSSANNYASFWDDNGMQGRIEGQTYGELTTSFDFIWSNAMSAAHEALAIAMAIACGFQLDFGEVAVWGAEAAIITAEWIVYNVEITNKVGVLFESGSGDYAEWLERENPSEDINFGEIVGVKGGRISRNTHGADHIMVVSMSPIVLGNMPSAAKEKDFEKVAFMGQVPVRVMGKVAIGDYIVASGNNDGYAKAIHPKNMRPEDFAQMVGVAWQSGESFPMNVVNVAVGINSQDWVGKAMEQQKNIDELSLQVSDMQQQLNQLYALLGQAPPYPIAATPVNLQVKAEVTNPGSLPVTESNTTNVKLELSELLDQHGDVFVQSFTKARERLVEKGIDVNKFPEVATIYQDPINWIRVQNEKGYLDELYLQVKQKAKK